MVSLVEIKAARERIAGAVIHTPVVTDPTGSGLKLKLESLQITGSFKLRGAMNRVMQAVATGAKHVVTGSSGNHGQAVAYAAMRLGIKATIVVPIDAPQVKVRGIISYGATVEKCGYTSNERLARAQELVETVGAVFIPPYDDDQVQAGAGTIGLEILEQVPDVEFVYVPIGGGGLISGVATALKESNPNIRVIGVEPELANDTFQSRLTGQIVDIGQSKTIADGLRTSHPGALTFPVVQRYVDEIMLVNEEEIKRACRLVLERFKVVCEPSGAVSVAAALRAGGKAVAVVSGGNIDLDNLHGVPAWEKA